LCLVFRCLSFWESLSDIHILHSHRPRIQLANTRRIYLGANWGPTSLRWQGCGCTIWLATPTRDQGMTVNIVRSSRLMSGSGRKVNLLKISAAVSAVKPMNSSVATLMVDCGRSKMKSGEELKLLKRTEAELLDERETLPWVEGGVRRVPLTFRLPEVDGILELRKTRSSSSTCVS
jgi:hypothetical protein